MTYAELLKNAVANKTARELAPVFVQWKEEGHTIVGRLLSKSTIKSRQSGGEYTDYVVETDEGAVHFACGNQFDEKIGSSLTIGKVYAWTFNGKRDIGKGRRVNDFSCVYVPEEQATFDLGTSTELPI